MRLTMKSNIAKLCFVFIITHFVELCVAQPSWQSLTSPASKPIYSILNRPSGELIVSTNGAGVFRSSNSGASWTTSSFGLTTQAIFILVSNSPNYIFAASDSGVFRSTDNGLSWSPANKGLTERNERYVGSMTITSNGILFLTTNNNFVYRSLDSAKSWSYSLVDPTFQSPATFITASPTGSLLVGTSGGGIFKSADNGNSWVQKKNGLPNSQMQPIVVNQAGYIFAGSIAREPYTIFRSTDDGESWINTGFPYRVRSLTVSRFGVLLAGTIGNGVLISSNDAFSWSSFGLSTAQEITSMTFDSVGYAYAGIYPSGLFRLSQPITSVPSEEIQPNSLSLLQNYPNPFNSSTTIQFSLQESGFASLKIYNSLGQELVTLLSRQLRSGSHLTRWDANGYSSGTYFCRIQFGTNTLTRTLLLLK